MENDLNILQLHETFTVLLPIFLEIWDIILFLLAYIQEQEELMKKKYGGLVKKKPPLITKVIIFGCYFNSLASQIIFLYVF